MLLFFHTKLHVSSKILDPYSHLYYYDYILHLHYVTQIHTNLQTHISVGLLRGLPRRLRLRRGRRLHPPPLGAAGGARDGRSGGGWRALAGSWGRPERRHRALLFQHHHVVVMHGLAFQTWGVKSKLCDANWGRARSYVSGTWMLVRLSYPWLSYRFFSQCISLTSF